MARKLQIEWQEDTDEQKERYQREKDHQNRTRLQVLWLVRAGKPLSAVARIVGSIIEQRKNGRLGIGVDA